MKHIGYTNCLKNALNEEPIYSVIVQQLRFMYIILQWFRLIDNKMNILIYFVCLESTRMNLIWSCNLTQRSKVNFPVVKVCGVANIRNILKFGAWGDMFGTPTKLESEKGGSFGIINQMPPRMEINLWLATLALQLARGGSGRHHVTLHLSPQIYLHWLYWKSEILYKHFLSGAHAQYVFNKPR